MPYTLHIEELVDWTIPTSLAGTHDHVGLFSASRTSQSSSIDIFKSSKMYANLTWSGIPLTNQRAFPRGHKYALSERFRVSSAAGGLAHLHVLPLGVLYPTLPSPVQRY